MTAGTPHPSFVPRPNVPRKARSEASAPRLPKIPRTPRDGFQRKGRSPSFGRFKEGLGGKSKSLPEFFLGIPP